MRYTENDEEYLKARETITRPPICISDWKVVNSRDDIPPKYDMRKREADKNLDRQHDPRWNNNKRTMEPDKKRRDNRFRQEDNEREHYQSH